jgi:hypothetical protein
MEFVERLLRISESNKNVTGLCKRYVAHKITRRAEKNDSPMDYGFQFKCRSFI